MLMLAPAISFAALDADALLKSLARPAPAVTPFVEVRYSKLLEQPIVVKGQLEYHEDGTLVRAVKDPFQERTEIKGETVTIARVGKSPRTFSLKRAPELRSLLGGFSAVLGGGRTDLEKDFSIAVSGENSGWKVSLTPKSPQIGKYVHDIAIQGAANDAHCIVVTQPDEGASVMLVGKTAESKLPSTLSRDSVTGVCAKG
jgi:Outer membrane lipoprotein carrier protein LolA-like